MARPRPAPEVRHKLAQPVRAGKTIPTPRAPEARHILSKGNWLIKKKWRPILGPATRKTHSEESLCHKKTSIRRFRAEHPLEPRADKLHADHFLAVGLRFADVHDFSLRLKILRVPPRHTDLCWNPDLQA